MTQAIQYTWRVTLLGGLRAEGSASVITRFRTRKTASLLARLAFYKDRAHTRDEVAELLWPEHTPEAGRVSLRTALVSLRRQLEPPGVPSGAVLIAGRSNVRLNPQAVTSDATDFEEWIRESNAATSDTDRTDALSRAARCYGGELLPGLYEQWVLTERERLAASYRAALYHLTRRAEALGNLDAALEFALRAVSVDRAEEEAHRGVIRLYRDLGRPAEALRQYGDLTKILKEDLGAEPSEETRTLMDSLRAAAEAPGAVTLTAPSASKERQPDVSPRIRSARVQQHALPAPLSAFFGREAEIAALSELLLGGLAAAASEASPSPSRLVCLVGVGGIGKTRLAVEVVRRILTRLGCPVWFVPLSDLSEPEAVACAIVGAMHGSCHPREEGIASVAAVFADRRALLILDNCEHLAPAVAAAIRELTERCPRLVCLTTSRTRLRVEGERVFRVSPLEIPDACEAEESSGSLPVMRLFLDRAQAARPEFRITQANAGAVAELCRNLEGIPLAIELAASWANALTPRQMVVRWTGHSQRLATYRRGFTERHRSIRAVIEWSYRLLAPELQRVFVSLSVFRRGWSIEAAGAICAVEPSPQTDLRDSLRLLVDASLVETIPCADADGDGWAIQYRMLEPMRRFAAEQQSEAERAETGLRHARHYLAVVTAYCTAPSLRPPVQLEHDLENILAARAWAESSNCELAPALSIAIAALRNERERTGVVDRRLEEASEEPVNGLPLTLKGCCDGAQEVEG